MTAVVLVAASVSACSQGPETAISTPGRQVATYTEPSTYRVGESELRRLTEELDPDSPQRKILADGRVSGAELQQAWVGYTGCMLDVGFTVSTPVWDPIGNVEKIYTYQRRGTARPASPAGVGMTDDEVHRIDDCEANFWFPVSAIYAAEAANHMTPLLTTAMAACMTKRGYDVRGSTSYGDVVGARSGYAQGPRVEAGSACLSQAMAKLYPDLPYHPDP